MSWYLQLPASGLFLLICLLLLFNKLDADIQSTPDATQSADQPMPPPVKHFKLLSKDIPVRSSTSAGTDADAEMLSYISASQTYVEDEGLAFWHQYSACHAFDAA